jgi:NADH:ubiquinone oxidoreductase subunit K
LYFAATGAIIGIAIIILLVRTKQTRITRS